MWSGDLLLCTVQTSLFSHRCNFCTKNVAQKFATHGQRLLFVLLCAWTRFKCMEQRHLNAGAWPKYDAKSSIHARRSRNISVWNITELVHGMQILVLRFQSWLFGVFELYLAHSYAIYLSSKRNYVQKKPDGGPLSSSHISTQLILSSNLDLFFILHKITAFAISCYCGEEIVIGSP